jgi:hypothetical protein
MSLWLSDSTLFVPLFLLLQLLSSSPRSSLSLCFTTHGPCSPPLLTKYLSLHPSLSIYLCRPIGLRYLFISLSDSLLYSSDFNLVFPQLQNLQSSSTSPFPFPLYFSAGFLCSSLPNQKWHRGFWNSCKQTYRFSCLTTLATLQLNSWIPVLWTGIQTTCRGRAFIGREQCP